MLPTSNALVASTPRPYGMSASLDHGYSLTVSAYDGFRVPTINERCTGIFRARNDIRVTGENRFDAGYSTGRTSEGVISTGAPRLVF